MIWGACTNFWTWIGVFKICTTGTGAVAGDPPDTTKGLVLGLGTGTGTALSDETMAGAPIPGLRPTMTLLRAACCCFWAATGGWGVDTASDAGVARLISWCGSLRDKELSWRKMSKLSLFSRSTPVNMLMSTSSKAFSRLPSTKSSRSPHTSKMYQIS